MKLYLDTDLFLALIKDEDRFQKAAEKFLEKNSEEELFTSIITCLEVWFYLYRKGLGAKALGALRAIAAKASVIDVGLDSLESAALLAQKFSLSPADALHATLALKFDGIVSTDRSFDSIAGLKRTDFSAKA